MLNGINRILIKIGVPLIFCYACGFPGSSGNTEKLPSDPQAIFFLHWLNGKWKHEMKEGTMTESWNINDSSRLLSGDCYVVSGKDTLFSEWMEIEQKPDELHLKVRQKKDSATAFKFVLYDKGEFVFANMENQYPQRIIYKNPQPDFLCVRIEGTVDGKLRKEDFSFVRLK